MGKKRQHPDSESSANDHEGIARKRPRPNHRHHARGQKAVDDSLNAIKKRVRDIERLLARENLKLPANKQNDLERELAAHKQRLADAQAKKARSKMIHKYHMVRFFERKKAMRFAKQLEKRLAQATDPDEVSQLEADLHVAQVDIDYAKYFPFMEPYISLYAKAAPGGADEKSTAAHYLRSPRPPMWTLVEKIREEGITALERLQNRQPGRSSGSTALPQQPKQGDRAKPSRPPSKEAKEGTSPRNARLSRSKPAKIDQEASEAGGQEESSDSDGGGFFEEE